MPSELVLLEHVADVKQLVMPALLFQLLYGLY